jgi:hypothetical protein
MLSDLMVMFEAAGASATNDNLTLVFNFEEDRKPLSFDLNSFRHWQFAWQAAEAATEQIAWNHDSLREVKARLEAMSAASRTTLPSEVGDWLEQYEHEGTWPRSEPPPMVFGSGPLDWTTRQLWTVWYGLFARAEQSAAVASLSLARDSTQSSSTAAAATGLVGRSTGSRIPGCLQASIGRLGGRRPPIPGNAGPQSQSMGDGAKRPLGIHRQSAHCASFNTGTRRDADRRIESANLAAS